MKYRFAGCEIDDQKHELTVGGEQRSVEPQVFDLLLLLARRPGDLVTRDDLIDTVWKGRIVSESTISARINAARRAVGDDGARQAIIATAPRRGIKLVAAVERIGGSEQGSADASTVPPPLQPQRIRFCHSRDGTGIAFATFGDGPPLVRAGHWLSHLEHDWKSPLWRPVLDRFGQSFRLTRYDQRGNGLSDRQPQSYSLESTLDDLEAVVDAAGLDRFALYGLSQGAPVAVAYAARHPARVSHLILQGGYVQGRLLRASAEERAKGEALLALIRHGWGDPNGAFIQAFSSIFIPVSTPEQNASLTELQRITASAENAARIREAADRFDVEALLEKVTAPTLVLHASGDAVQPLDEGRRLAAGIPNAEFVLLDTRNHGIVADDPAFATMIDAIEQFVGAA